MADQTDQTLWPFEAFVDEPDGDRAYYQQARDNGDGTVTVLEFSGGFMERTFLSNGSDFSNDLGNEQRSGTRCTRACTGGH